MFWFRFRLQTSNSWISAVESNGFAYFIFQRVKDFFGIFLILTIDKLLVLTPLIKRYSNSEEIITKLSREEKFYSTTEKLRLHYIFLRNTFFHAKEK